MHSLKDLPTAPEPGLVVAAVPVREDSRDVLVARDGLTLGELPAGSVVGTGSPRRTAQLAALGLGIEIRPIRGNVDTRIGFVSSGALDAVVLARAGLARLGRLDEATEVIDPIQVLPAPGQGALAVECRSDRDDVVAAVSVLDDPDTRDLRRRPSARCSRRSRPGAPRPSGRSPRSSRATTASSCRCVPSPARRTAPPRCAARSSGPTTEPEVLGSRLARILLEDGAADLQVATASAGPAPDHAPHQPEQVS